MKKKNKKNIMKCNKNKLFETEAVHLYYIITKIKLAYES